MKKTILRFLVLLLLAAAVAVQAQVYYSTNADGNITIDAYTGPPWDVTIPTNINGLLVTSLGDSAFENLTNLMSVTIPGGITNIGQKAFLLCSGLTNVTIANGVTSIGGKCIPAVQQTGQCHDSRQRHQCWELYIRTLHQPDEYHDPQQCH